jgi:spore maturation protein CgeB
MSYTFVKVTTFYSHFLEQFFKKNHAISEEGYETGLQKLLETGFGWADYYSRNLKNLGVNAHEIVGNATEIQKAWLKEQRTETDLDEKSIILLQLQYLKPDVVFMEDPLRYGGEWLPLLREKVPSIKQIIGYLCAPFNEGVAHLSSFDYMLSCHPGFLEHLLSAGFKAYRLNHAFESSWAPKLQENNPFPEADFVFIGSILLGQGYHNLRWEIIRDLLRENIDLKIYGSLTPMTAADRLKLEWSKPFLRKLRIHPPVFGFEALQILAHSKLSFNNHIDASGAFAANMRLFEATGAGSCLITDHKENIKDFFEPDHEIVTYVSAHDCVEKVNWLLGHPEQAKEIAVAGQRRVLNEHTYAHRAGELDRIIRENL